MSEERDQNLEWMYQDLKGQLRSAVDMLFVLRGRVDDLKIKLTHHLDQGEGLTHDELSEVCAEIERLFPRRVRKPSDNLDAPL